MLLAGARQRRRRGHKLLASNCRGSLPDPRTDSARGADKTLLMG
jgi:hypothetical protein